MIGALRRHPALCWTAGFLLASAGSLAAQEGSSRLRPSGELAVGASLQVGNHDEFALELAPDLKWQRPKVEFRLKADALLHIARDEKPAVTDDGRAVERVVETSNERYDVEPSVQWHLRQGMDAVLDYDWRRNTDNGISHHHLFTIGVQGGLSTTGTKGSRTLAFRGGFMHETDTDGDRVIVPAAVVNFQEDRRFGAGGSVGTMLELLSNVREPADLRLRFEARVQAPLTSKLSLSIGLRSAYRNRPTMLLVDPQNWSSVYECDRMHLTLEPRISWGF